MSIPVRPNPCGVSPEALARLSPAERALLFAADECDHWKAQEEPKGSNRGPRVDAYLASAGLNPGYAWCAAFVFWCFREAGAKPAVKGPAAVVNWHAASVAKKAILPAPKRGCLFAYVLKGRTHIGFVAGTNADGTFRTIEGNTNDDGSREGYETARKVRAVKAPGLVFIDVARLI